MKIKTFTIEARVKLSRNYNTVEAGGVIEVEFDEAEAERLTIGQAIEKSAPQRKKLLEAVRDEARELLQTL